MAAITYRYKWVGYYPLTVKAQIDTSSVFVMQRPTNQSFMDCLYDDAFPKIDLDNVMKLLGWEYVSTPTPPTPLPGIYQGSGSPEGVVDASPGSLYQNIDGGLLVAALWVKNTGILNIGWIPK